jgi:hypothetical protein
MGKVGDGGDGSERSHVEQHLWQYVLAERSD